MPENNNPPGKNNATASLVLGIIAVIFWFFGYSSILSIILGIVGLIQASKAKELGYDDAIRTAGFVLSLIGLIGGALALLACAACVSCAGLVGVSNLYPIHRDGSTLTFAPRHDCRGAAAYRRVLVWRRIWF